MRALRFNDFGSFNGADTLPTGYVFNRDDWVVWSNCIDCCPEPIRAALPKGRALSAVVSTLVQAGLIWSDGECLGLQQPGFDVVEAS